MLQLYYCSVHPLHTFSPASHYDVLLLAAPFILSCFPLQCAATLNQPILHPTPHPAPTGEGIHTAMMGGKAAAEVLLQCREAGDFSKRSTRLYERRWMELFGHDFKLVGS